MSENRMLLSFASGQFLDIVGHPAVCQTRHCVKPHLLEYIDYLNWPLVRIPTSFDESSSVVGAENPPPVPPPPPPPPPICTSQPYCTAFPSESGRRLLRRSLPNECA